MNAQQWISHLDLRPHPEGGSFRETFRSPRRVLPADAVADPATNSRDAITAIYYLLGPGEVSRLHRIKADEIWHFYSGDGLEIWQVTPAGKILGHRLDARDPQYAIPAGHWFGAMPVAAQSWALVGCTVAPGFEFGDWALAADNGEFPASAATHPKIRALL